MKNTENIRINKREPETHRPPGARPCAWEKCAKAGSYPAPFHQEHARQDHAGQKPEEQKHDKKWFCLDHIRLYNKNYNFFKDMSQEQIESWQKSSVTGHRPTWPLGARGRKDARGQSLHGMEDLRRASHAFFQQKQQQQNSVNAPRVVDSDKQKALAILKFDTTDMTPAISPARIRKRYKKLVKRYHPDTNKGRRDAEDLLRDIIWAYGYLKEKGFC